MEELGQWRMNMSFCYSTKILWLVLTHHQFTTKISNKYWLWQYLRAVVKLRTICFGHQIWGRRGNIPRPGHALVSEIFFKCSHQHNVSKEKQGAEEKTQAQFFIFTSSTNTTQHETVAIPHKTKKQRVKMDLINDWVLATEVVSEGCSWSYSSQSSPWFWHRNMNSSLLDKFGSL